MAALHRRWWDQSIPAGKEEKMYRIRTLNNISPSCREILSAPDYELSDSEQNPDALFVRASDLHGYPFNPEQIYNYALDRMDGKVEYVEGMPYIDTPVDIDARFDEIVGVTYMKDAKLQDIYFAVRPASVNYIRTKMIHSSQDEVNIETERDFIRRYPALKDCKFFFISCRPNRELFALFASYGPDVIIIEPTEIREELHKMLQEAAENYKTID